MTDLTLLKRPTFAVFQKALKSQSVDCRPELHRQLAGLVTRESLTIEQILQEAHAFVGIENPYDVDKGRFDGNELFRNWGLVSKHGKSRGSAKAAAVVYYWLHDAQKPVALKIDGAVFPEPLTTFQPTPSGRSNVKVLEGDPPFDWKTRESRIHFVNKTDSTLDLFWIDDTGYEVFYNIVPPGSTFRQRTYLGHRWVLRDKETKEKRAFVISEDFDQISEIS